MGEDVMGVSEYRRFSHQHVKVGAFLWWLSMYVWVDALAWA
jgi:hypothetical protein